MAQAPQQDIDFNRAAHDAVAGDYDVGHPEIFNEIEQARLAGALAHAVALAQRPDSGPVRALDVGAGTGNVTRHLLSLGAHVTAADLSSRLLEVTRAKFGASGRLQTQVLNGRDLAPLADGTFDLAVVYSVLHHVPDYAALVAEMARVVRPGGIVYIDHERNDASWSSESYRSFLHEAVVWPRRRWWFFLQPSRYWKRVRPLFEWRRWFNPRWMPEGDLHIWPDDHIEWPVVETALASRGCRPLEWHDYLLYEPRYDRAAWERWRARASDMRLLIARKDP